VCLCMYVCVYVCMYVYMQVCVCLCMYVCMCVCVYGPMLRYLVCMYVSHFPLSVSPAASPDYSCNAVVGGIESKV